MSVESLIDFSFIGWKTINTIVKVAEISQPRTATAKATRADAAVITIAAKIKSKKIEPIVNTAPIPISIFRNVGHAESDGSTHTTNRVETASN